MNNSFQPNAAGNLEIKVAGKFFSSYSRKEQMGIVCRAKAVAALYKYHFKNHSMTAVYVERLKKRHIASQYRADALRV